MQVTDISVSAIADCKRVEAKIVWEDCGREPLHLFIEAENGDSNHLNADPNGFLLAALLPAWKQGERRLLIEGQICPLLNSRIKTALFALSNWYPELGSVPIIETTEGYHALSPVEPRSGCFLSCGIDSLATLRSNRLHLPMQHPAAILGVVSIDYVLQFGRTIKEEENRTMKRFRMAATIADDTGCSLTKLRTNILALETDGYFFAYKWCGAVLAAIAHFFRRGFDRFYIASGAIPPQGPFGSHPLLDPYYGSANLQIEHDGMQFTRFEKTTLVAGWEVGLQNIFVCEGKRSGDSNCGKCHKCIQTMAALVALGRLEDCNSFPLDDVTPDLLKTVQEYGMLYGDHGASCYRDLIPALSERDRQDLVLVIENFLNDYDHAGPSPR